MEEIKMLSWAFVLETIIKWAIPVIATAIIGLVVKHLIDPKRRDLETGEVTRKQNEWDDYARHSEVMSEKCNNQINIMNAAIETRFRQVEEKTQEKNNEILVAVKDLQKSVAEIRADIRDNKSESKVLQKGVLDLHLHNLIQTCKVYIERGYISPIELMQYNERLTIYHSLGGNGHMDIWDERIRNLPIHEHVDGDL